MQTETQPLTDDDLLQLTGRHELVRGALRPMSPAGYEHGLIAMMLGSSLRQHVAAHRLGTVTAAETGFRLGPDTVRAPDVGFVSRERAEAVGRPSGYWPGAPDLSIEVVSPHDSYSDVIDKLRDFFEAGTLVVLVVNPRNRTVAVHRSPVAATLVGVGETLTVDDVVPGWSVPVADLFS